MKERLIVGFDATEASASALRWAAREAEDRDAVVRVISSYLPPPVYDFYGMGLGSLSTEAITALQEACASQLAEAVEELSSRYKATFEQHCVLASAVDALVSESPSAALVVVGSSGAGAGKGLLLGSVTTRVLLQSKCPVAVVPKSLPERRGWVVVGVDGSRPSDAALRWAIAEAERRESELTVLHAWEYPYTVTKEGLGRGGEFAQVDAAVVLNRAVEEAREATGVAVEERLVEGGPAAALLDAADTADLVVVGSRGRGGFRTMLLGSVAHSVAAHATCPVIVVR